jgi:hypothetical protein
MYPEIEPLEVSFGVGVGPHVQGVVASSESACQLQVACLEVAAEAEVIFDVIHVPAIRVVEHDAQVMLLLLLDPLKPVVTNGWVDEALVLAVLGGAVLARQRLVVPADDLNRVAGEAFLVG